MQRHCREYIVPGLDFIWSIDGHDKLSAWGIEIYAGIDGYSRNIIWIYVGISNRTTISVASQYLLTVHELGYHPRIIRSDRGKETDLLSEIHYLFSRTTAPEIPFEETYFYGTSTHNQRIESW